MSVKLPYRGSEPQRINKWLGQSGVCSRREAEALILAGKVRVDGALVRDPGTKLLPGQTLEVDTGAAGTPSDGPALGGQLTCVVNKPVGYVSAQPEPRQIPAARLLTPANLVGPGSAPGREARLAPLGRLDQDSRGLLLLSDDGVLAKAVIGPSSALDKEYLVAVSGQVTGRKLTLLRHGLTLDGRALKPAKVSQTQDGRLRFILTEGRNRQIRRMCQAVGLEVQDLLRVRIGPIALGPLAEGHWRVLTPAERQAMVHAAQGAQSG